MYYGESYIRILCAVDASDEESGLSYTPKIAREEGDPEALFSNSEGGLFLRRQ